MVTKSQVNALSRLKAYGVAMQSSNPMAMLTFREFALGEIMGEVQAKLRAAGWYPWKRNAVAKYVRSSLRDLTVDELARLDPSEVDSMVERAGQGFDRWRGRTLR